MVSKILDPILNIFRYHKRKILVFCALYLTFIYFLFPFNDLGDFVAAKVSELTGGQVFVTFEKLDMSLLPEPGLSLTDMSVETPFTPKLSAKELSVAPSITGLLTFKPGVSLRAYEILGGDISLTTRGGDSNANKTMKQKVGMKLSRINLSEVMNLASFQPKMNGQVSGEISGQIDPDFVDQPTAQIETRIEQASLPESKLDTMMGPIDLPKMDLGSVDLEGKLEKGSLEIAKLTVGRRGGDIYADVTGRLDVKMLKQADGIVPQLGAFDFTVRLQFNDALKQKLGMFLGILSQYSSGPNAYAFRAQGASVYGPPNLSRVQ